MAKFEDLTGQRFGRLTVLEHVSSAPTKWACRCDCGTVKTIRAGCFKGGHTKSCGCLERESKKCVTRTHGHTVDASETPTYTTWRAMHYRCYGVGGASYASYGSRGILVCERWHLFENFISDMGERLPGMSIDRINNDLGYEPENCRWATTTEQSRNRRMCKMTPDLVNEIHGRVEHGESKRSVSNRLGINYDYLRNIVRGSAWKEFRAKSPVGMLAVLLLGGTLATQAGCTAAQKTQLQTGAAVAINCEVEDLKPLVAELLPLATQYVLSVVSSDGKAVDTAALSKAWGTIKSDQGRCALATAIAVLSTPAPKTVGAPAAAALEVDPTALRAAYSQVRAAHGWGDTRTSHGVL